MLCIAKLFTVIHLWEQHDDTVQYGTITTSIRQPQPLPFPSNFIDSSNFIGLHSTSHCSLYTECCNIIEGTVFRPLRDRRIYAISIWRIEWSGHKLVLLWSTHCSDLHRLASLSTFSQAQSDSTTCLILISLSLHAWWTHLVCAAPFWNDRFYVHDCMTLRHP